MGRRPPRSTQRRSSAASDVYKRQGHGVALAVDPLGLLHRRASAAALRELLAPSGQHAQALLPRYRPDVRPAGSTQGGGPARASLAWRRVRKLRGRGVLQALPAPWRASDPLLLSLIHISEPT